MSRASSNLPDVIRVDRAVLRLGRDRAADVRLPHPAVSRRHAELRRDGSQTRVRDLGSQAGILVNGVAVADAVLKEGDRVAFGPVVYCLQAGELHRVGQVEGVRLDARDLAFRRGNATILEGVSLALPPGRFIGILGPSGAGKTTLLKGLTGFLPTTAGQIYYDGLDLAAHRDICRSLIGFVPQEDLVHATLTARENLDFALRLRVGKDLGSRERAAWVQGTLERLNLRDHADRPCRDLSGGQRKRVSVAVELLARPRLLFLDEPTAGLDPSTDRRLMKFLQELARSGTTVICTTHVMESVDLFDAVVVVAGGGVVGSGPPPGLLKHFQVADYAELYDKLESWPRPKARPLPPPPRAKGPQPGSARSGLVGQTVTLIRRNLRLIARDRTLLALLVGQPLLIGLLIGLCQCTPYPFDAGALLMFAVLACLWLGLNNTAREVVRDRDVYVRERRAALQPESFLLGKVLLFAGIGLGQVILLILWLRFVDIWFLGTSPRQDLEQLSLLTMLLVFWLTYLSAMMLGLLVSTLAPTQEVAVGLVPLLVLPQMLLTRVAAGIPKDTAYFRPLLIMAEKTAEMKDGVAAWLLEWSSLLTYARPALTLLEKLPPEERKRPDWIFAADWAHLLLLLLLTATTFVAVFLVRERRWLERG
jgi:ABC transport system ATP-binding/permease protein